MYVNMLKNMRIMTAQIQSHLEGTPHSEWVRGLTNHNTSNNEVPENLVTCLTFSYEKRSELKTMDFQKLTIAVAITYTMC